MRKPRVMIMRPGYPDFAYKLSVLSYQKREGACSSCGAKGVIFVCDGFGLGWPRGEQIRELCKPCAINAAGGEEWIWAKTTFPRLLQVWKRERRPEASESQRRGLEKARAGRLTQSARS